MDNRTIEQRQKDYIADPLPVYRLGVEFCKVNGVWEEVKKVKSNPRFPICVGLYLLGEEPTRGLYLWKYLGIPTLVDGPFSWSGVVDDMVDGVEGHLEC